jgi:hypothetical protein
MGPLTTPYSDQSSFGQTFSLPLFYLCNHSTKQALSACEGNLSSQQAALASVTRQLVTAQSSLASVEAGLASKRRELELLVRQCDEAADQEFKEGKSHLMEEGEHQGVDGRRGLLCFEKFLGQGIVVGDISRLAY